MTKLPLRTQIFAIFGLLQLLIAGSGLIYWSQSKNQLRLSRSIDEHSYFLVNLPSLRMELIQVQFLGTRYLLTGNESWLQKRSRSLKRIHELRQKILSPRLTLEEKDLLREVFKRLDIYLSGQAQFIDLKRSGKLPGPQMIAAMDKEASFNSLLEAAIFLKGEALSTLAEKQISLQQTALLTFCLTLIISCLGCLGLAFLAAHLIAEPLRSLLKSAEAWEPSKPLNLKLDPPNKETHSLAVCFQDMAQRLNIQFNGLSQLEKIKSQILSAISHEYNSSLTMAYGMLSCLEESERSAFDSQRHHLKMLEDNLRSLSWVSIDLIHLCRLESGLLAVNPQKIEIRKIIQECLQLLQPLYEHKKQHVYMELPENVIPVKGDPKALAMVVNHLIVNAIRHTPAGREISVGVIREAGYSDRLQIFIQDSGPGLAPEDLERIFSGNFRSDFGKKASDGFGIGLMMARLILESHQTNLLIETNPGKGSRFAFKLPVWHDPGDTFS